MNELNSNNTVNQQDNSIVSFKLSKEEKEKLVLQANDIGISLSELIRIKLFLDESEGIKLYEECEDLKQQIKVFKVKEKSYQASKIDPGSIILKTTEEGKEIIRRTLHEMCWNIAHNHRVNVETDYEIAEAITHILTMQLWDEFKEFTGLISKLDIHNPDEFYERIFGFYK